MTPRIETLFAGTVSTFSFEKPEPDRPVRPWREPDSADHEQELLYSD